MLLEKIAIEVLALIVVLVLLLSFIMVARRVRSDLKKRVTSPEDELAHFDELLQEHERLRSKKDTDAE